VGADVYVALGLVMAAAQGATPLAFLIAGIVYIMVGLAYTEMAAAYPSAGGGQYFTLRGLGDFWGLVAGAALMLDYTVDVALFAMASAGYINFFFPAFREFRTTVGPFHDVNLIWLAETLVLILLLALLNVKGIRESSLFNSVLGALDLVMESSIIVIGFAFAWQPELFLHQWRTQFPPTEQLLYAVSIAVISYVGLESVSQAAIKEPHVPRPYRVPLNLRWRDVEIPIPGVLGVIGTGLMVLIVLYTHDIARITGPIWVGLWVLYYAWYRRRTGRPVWGSLPRDWDAQQLKILEDTGEYELLERFRIERMRRQQERGRA
jgi:amino acid transporter